MGLWDLYQHSQIRGIERSQRLAERSAELRDHRHERDVEDLEERVAQLGTLVEALWTLARGGLGLTDDQLVEAIDDVLERRRELATPVRCPRCDAAIGLELDKCQFCGAPSPRPADAFRGL